MKHGSVIHVVFTCVLKVNYMFESCLGAPGFSREINQLRLLRRPIDMF